MKKTNIALAGLAVFLLGIVGAGLAIAHGSDDRTKDDMMGMFDIYDSDMHDAVDRIMEQGNYQDFDNLREKYRMPMMHWVGSEEHFELAKQIHSSFDDEDGFGMMGYRCH